MKLEELREIQNRKLRAIIKYSYENVEFYHRRMKALGLGPNDIRSVDDLRKLPITKRSDIQKNFPIGLTSKQMKNAKFEKHTTSGSTSVPITVLSDSKTEAYRAALFARPFFECGVSIRDKMMRITTAPQYVNWYERLGLMSKTFLHPRSPINIALGMLEEFRPNAIFGHASYIWLMANEISKTGKCPGSMIVFTTADMISPKMRDLVRSIFGGKVFDLYGCIEVERVAWECPKREGYHLDIDSQVIEFVEGSEPVAPGESGRILLTCLYNYAMPLIRYDIGDIGTSTGEMCSCGRGLPMMRSIEGRVSDFLKRPDGSLITPTALLALEFVVSGISRFRVTHKKRDEIYVELVLDGPNPEDTVRKSKAYLKKVVGEDIRVDIAVVEDIPREKSGKLMSIKSLV